MDSWTGRALKIAGDERAGGHAIDGPTYDAAVKQMLKALSGARLRIELRQGPRSAEQ